MRSDVIVISSIGLQDAAQMLLAQDDKVVHTLAPDRSDQPFGKGILPRRRLFIAVAPGRLSACGRGALAALPRIGAALANSHELHRCRDRLQAPW
jgi:hypothetical protein